MCSSMAMYSKPFCKNVINAPGGISVWAVLDFTTSDSCAKVNAEWENPVLVRTRGVSGAINIDWSVFASECCSPFSDKYRKIKKFTSSEEMLISSSQPKYIIEIKSKAGNKATAMDPPATGFMKATNNACMLCKLSIRIYKFGNSLFKNHPAGFFLWIITGTEFMHNKLLVRCIATELHCLHYLNIDTILYRAMNREVKTFVMKRKTQLLQ